MLLTSRWGRRRCGREQGATISAENEVARLRRYRMSRTVRRPPALLSAQRGLSLFVVARRGRVLHRRAIVSVRFDGVGLRPVRINAPDFCRRGNRLGFRVASTN